VDGSLCSISGKNILSFKTSGNSKIDVRNIKPGNYFLSLDSKDNCYKTQVVILE
jgi:hypothetical protein